LKIKKENYKLNPRGKLIKNTFIIIFFIFLWCSPSFTETIHETINIASGTEYETPVTIIKTGIKKPVAMIISGTHGNEPAGIAAGKILEEEINIKRGTLLILPQANILACQNKTRNYPQGINLNRVYPGNQQGNMVEVIAAEIYNLMKLYDIDLLLDLHESREFYKINPLNYGQTLVLDCFEDTFMKICLSVAGKLNEKIVKSIEKYEVFAKPIEGSATYAASCLLKIPAITFETCKKLSLQRRIEMQKQFVKLVLAEFNFFMD